MKNKLSLIICIIIIIVLIIVGLVFINKKDNENSTENETKAQNTTENNSSTNSSNSSLVIPIATPESKVPEEMNNQLKSIFNASFDMYLGTKVSASNVKALISTIRHSNNNSPVRPVSLSINGENTLDVSKLNQTSTYSVSFEYDDNGLICKAIVNEN